MADDSQYVLETGVVRGVTVWRPLSWERLELPDVELAMAARAPDDPTRLRLNFIVMVAPTDASIESASSRAIAAAIALSPSVHILSCDALPDHRLGFGRQIGYAYPTPGGAVFVSQWVFIRRGHEIVATASCPVDQVLATDPTFERVAGTLQLPEPSWSS